MDELDATLKRPEAYQRGMKKNADPGKLVKPSKVFRHLREGRRIIFSQNIIKLNDWQAEKAKNWFRWLTDRSHKWWNHARWRNVLFYERISAHTLQVDKNLSNSGKETHGNTFYGEDGFSWLSRTFDIEKWWLEWKRTSLEFFTVGDSAGVKSKFHFMTRLIEKLFKFHFDDLGQIKMFHHTQKCNDASFINTPPWT